ncbi:MAG TPA: MoaD/ThiS family protein [Candidatus Baltobacteraceae bacterium]|nr:MoaD/ThiS family protein [Candidatus Baltobacteraceae bacterium]
MRVLVFARLREMLGSDRHDVELPADARIGDVWRVLEQRSPAIRELAQSCRAARNGRIVGLQETVAGGDEIALLPPVGGG